MAVLFQGLGRCPSDIIEYINKTKHVQNLICGSEFFVLREAFRTKTFFQWKHDPPSRFRWEKQPILTLKPDSCFANSVKRVSTFYSTHCFSLCQINAFLFWWRKVENDFRPKWVHHDSFWLYRRARDSSISPIHVYFWTKMMTSLFFFTRPPCA